MVMDLRARHLMMWFLVVIALALPATLAGCGQTGSSTDPAANHGPDAGSDQPAVFDTAGERLTFSDVTRDGRLCTLLVFATAWCKECRNEQPLVEEWAAAHHRDSRVRYVFSGSTVDGAIKLKQDRVLDFPVVADPDGELADRYGVSATPTLILFDPGGGELGRASRVDELPDAPQPEPDESSRVPGSENTWYWDLWHDEADGYEDDVATITRLPDGRWAIGLEGRDLGTTFNVMVTTDIADRSAAAALADARSHITYQKLAWSEWEDRSLISLINREAPGKVFTVPENGRTYLHWLKVCIDVSRATGGAFDITWKPLGAVWKRAEEEQRLPDPVALARVLEAVGSDGLEITDTTIAFQHPDTQIGVAGFAKGYIIDLLFLMLAEGSRSFADVIVNIGGDLRLTGHAVDGGPHRIRIVDPWEPEKTAAWLVLDTPAAIATSGAYMRYRTINGKRYGHIVDPRTGYPPEFDGSVTVLTRDCAMADALATALFVMGPDEGLAFARKTAGVDAVFVTRDGVRSTLGDDILERERPEGEGGN